MKKDTRINKVYKELEVNRGHRQKKITKKIICLLRDSKENVHPKKAKIECYIYKDDNQGLRKTSENQSRINIFFKSTESTYMTQMVLTEKKKKMLTQTSPNLKIDTH